MARPERVSRRRKLTLANVVGRAVELGAKEAKLISPQSVVTAEWVRLKCQYGCGGYGKCLTCPPNSPTPEQTRRMLDGYGTAVLLHFDEHWGPVRKVVAALERELFLSGYYKAFAFACGGCELCDECNIEGSCVHPREARPAMEASGIDVYATARNNGYPIEVVTSRTCGQNYYGLVVIE